MALINCPECGKEISSQANNCPHCGYPISERTNGIEGKAFLEPLEIVQTDTSIVSKQSKGRNPKLFVLLVCCDSDGCHSGIFPLAQRKSPCWNVGNRKDGIRYYVLV